MGLLDAPTVLHAHGEPPKTILEFVGRASTGDPSQSIALMRSPAGWSEPGQTPAFEETTVVVSGRLEVTTRDGIHVVGPGEAYVSAPGQWVRYATPERTEYVAVCRPAFDTAAVHRDEA